MLTADRGEGGRWRMVGTARAGSALRLRRSDISAVAPPAGEKRHARRQGSRRILDQPSPAGSHPACKARAGSGIGAGPGSRTGSRAGAAVQPRRPARQGAAAQSGDAAPQPDGRRQRAVRARPGAHPRLERSSRPQLVRARPAGGAVRVPRQSPAGRAGDRLWHGLSRRAQCAPHQSPRSRQRGCGGAGDRGIRLRARRGRPPQNHQPLHARPRHIFLHEQGPRFHAGGRRPCRRHAARCRSPTSVGSG